MKKNILIILIFFICDLCFSHPHVFIDYQVEFIVNNGMLKGIDVTWNFDEYFSVSTTQNFDKNNNGKLDESEIEDFKNVTHDGIGQYNYYINLLINDKLKYINTIDNFEIKVESKEKVIFYFYIPCNIKINDNESKISIYFEDPTYFVACSTTQKEINIKSDGSVLLTNTKIKDEYEEIIFLKRPN